MGVFKRLLGRLYVSRPKWSIGAIRTVRCSWNCLMRMNRMKMRIIDSCIHFPWLFEAKSSVWASQYSFDNLNHGSSCHHQWVNMSNDEKAPKQSEILGAKYFDLSLVYETAESLNQWSGGHSPITSRNHLSRIWKSTASAIVCLACWSAFHTRRRAVGDCERDLCVSPIIRPDLRRTKIPRMLLPDCKA